MTRLTPTLRISVRLILIALMVSANPSFADHPSVALGVGTASPAITVSAEPLPKGMWAAGIQIEHQKFDEFSSQKLNKLAEESPDADIHSVGSLTSTSLGLSYGATPDLTVGLRIPFISRRDIREPAHGHGDEEEHHDEDETEEAGHHSDDESAEHHEEEAVAAEIEDLGDIDGIGDITLFGQYRFLNRPEKNTQAAFLFGLKTPTGSSDEKANGGFEIETEFQPGSGSWDPLAGLAVSRKFGRISLDISGLYTFTGEGDRNTELGNIFTYNAAVSMRVNGKGDGHAHHKHTGTEYNWDLIAEINGEWRDKEEIDNHENDNSGGNIIYLSPGARVSSSSGWFGSLSVGVPVVTNLNGDQVEPDYRVIASIGRVFSR